MAYVVVARWTAREGEQDGVRRAITALIGPSRAEAGVRFYHAMVDLDDPHVFVLVEVYDDAAAYQAHLDSPHFQRHAVGEASRCS
jgi:quinol monooxygenase YgiN